MLLYDHLDSGNCYKVRLLLTQLAIPFERVPVDLLGGQTRTAEFAALNPAGQVPVLVTDDGRTLTESNAILWHLAEGTPLLPDDPDGRITVLQWLMFEQSRIEPNLGAARFWLRFRPDVASSRAAELESRQRAGRAALRVLDRVLAASAFMAGDFYTIADVALYGYVHLAGEAGVPADRFPAVSAWLDRVRRIPGHVAIDRAVGFGRRMPHASATGT